MQEHLFAARAEKIHPTPERLRLGSSAAQQLGGTKEQRFKL